MITPQIVTEDFIPHWELTLSNEQYHADKTAVSSTSLKLVIERSPKAFLMAHNGLYRRETVAFNFGSAFHVAILEPDVFKKCFIVQPKFSGKGMKAAKLEWELTLPKDAITLTQDEYDDLLEMINSVLSHQDACNILKNGKAEQSGYFRDPETGIKCRIRPDFFHADQMAFLDVKTTTDVRASQFMRTIWNYRYDMQIAMYTQGIELIVGRPVQYPLILAVEKSAPYECALYLCDEIMMNKGLSDYKLAQNRLKQCIDDNMFDAYQKKIEPISLPAWAIKGDV